MSQIFLGTVPVVPKRFLGDFFICTSLCVGVLVSSVFWGNVCAGLLGDNIHVISLKKPEVSDY